MTTPAPAPDPGRPPFVPPSPPTGAIAWWMGLLVLFCLPFVSSVVAGLVMFFVGRAQRSKGPLAAENGRRAGNWGLTYALATVLIIGTHFVLLWLLTRDGDEIEGFFPFGLIITSWFVLSLVHVVLSIWGGVVASKGRVVRATGVPVMRARR